MFSYVKHIGAPYESVRAGLFKDTALMGIFPLPPPHVTFVNMISVQSNPWVIPSPDLVDAWGEVMLLSTAEINYMEIISASPLVSSDHLVLKTSLDVYSQSPWLGASESSDPLAKIIIIIIYIFFFIFLFFYFFLQEYPRSNVSRRSTLERYSSSFLILS